MPHAPGDPPESDIPRSAHSASSTARLSPLSSVRRRGTGCCTQRAAATGHLSSSAWPRPGGGEVRIEAHSESGWRFCVGFGLKCMWHHTAFLFSRVILCSTKNCSRLAQLTLLCVNSPVTLCTCRKRWIRGNSASN